jgi:hypothetical protein
MKGSTLNDKTTSKKKSSFKKSDKENLKQGDHVEKPV